MPQGPQPGSARLGKRNHSPIIIFGFIPDGIELNFERTPAGLQAQKNLRCLGQGRDAEGERIGSGKGSSNQEKIL